MTEQLSQNGGSVGIGFGVAPADEEGWKNSTRFTYAYMNDTVRVEKVKYVWEDDDWRLDSYDGTVYDFDVLEEELIAWTGLGSDFKIDRTSSYLTLGGVYGGYDFDYFYSENTPVSITGVAGVADGVNVWPTLVTEGFTVEAPEGSRVSVFNAGGARVKTASAGYINATDLPSDLYIVTVNGSRTKIVKK